MRRLLFAIAIIWFGNDAKASDTRGIEDKVKEGTTVATEIIKALGDDKVSKTFGKIGQIAGKIGQFLGSIGPAISLLSLFSDTPELTAIKEGFAKMDKKFDKVFNRFDEIDNLIRETSLKTQYVSYEHTILTLSKYLRRMLNAPTTELAASRKGTFITMYENSDKFATSNVWQGMMGEGVFSSNIPREAMKFFDNDRKGVQKVMKGTISLILQGVKVELAYEKAIGNDTNYANKRKMLKGMVKRVIRQSKKYDEEVRDKYQDQLKIDVDKKLKELRDEGHQGFANGLYSFLQQKYDWRTWFVISYNEIFGSGQHWGGECGGMHSYRQYGRNLRVASFDTDHQSPFNRKLAGSDLTALKYTLDAETMETNLSKTRWKLCSSAAATGVIREGSDDVRFKAPWYRMNYRRRPNTYREGFIAYIFG